MSLLLVLSIGCGPKVVPPAPITSPVAEAAPLAPPEPFQPTDEPLPAEALVEAAVPNPGSPLSVVVSPVADGAVGPERIAPAPTPSGPDKALSDAVAMLTTRDAGRARQALELLKPLVSVFPDVPEVPYNIGVAHHILGEDTEARRGWLRATEVDPSFAKSWLNLGALAARRGQYESALASFQAGIRQAPRDVDLRVAAIGAHRLLRRYPEAIAEAKAALQVNSKAIEVYNELTAVYLETSQIDLARFMCFKALEVIEGANQSARLHANFGQIHRRDGLGGDALASFRKALDLDPNQAAALGYLSSYFLDNRNYQDAIPLLERLVSLNPEKAGPRLTLGIAYRGEGRYEEAIRAYNDALRLEPNSADAHRNLAVLYGDYMKSWDLALAEIEACRRSGGGPVAELDAWAAKLRSDQERLRKKQEKAVRNAEEDRNRRAAAEAAAAAAEAAAAEAAAAEAAAAAAAELLPLVPEPLPEPIPPVDPGPTSDPWPTPQPTEPAPMPGPWPSPEPTPEPAPDPTPPPGDSEPSPWGN